MSWASRPVPGHKKPPQLHMVLFSPFLAGGWCPRSSTSSLRLYNDLRGSQRLANRRPVPGQLTWHVWGGGVDLPTAADLRMILIKELGQPQQLSTWPTAAIVATTTTKPPQRWRIGTISRCWPPAGRARAPSRGRECGRADPQAPAPRRPGAREGIIYIPPTYYQITKGNNNIIIKI